MADIEYLFFDLGNVILPFDHEIGATRIADSITAHPDQVIKWIFESGLQQSFETGEGQSTGVLQPVFWNCQIPI